MNLFNPTERKKMTKIIVLRIRGKIDLHPDIRKTFENLKLDRKFSCRIIENRPEVLGMVEKIKDHVAYNDADDKVIGELVSKRGDPNKKDIEQVFHLHPPRGGFKKSSRLAWPRGILGKNEKLNELVLKML